MDANHGEIVDALRAMGVSVQPLHTVGNGCPDLLCGYRGANVLLEVKQPGEKLNPVQTKWHREWGGVAHVVFGFSDALMVLQSYGRRG